MKFLIESTLNEMLTKEIKFWDWANKVNQDALGYLTPVNADIDNYLQSGADEDFVYQKDLDKVKEIVDEFSYYLYDNNYKGYIYDIANGRMYHDDKLAVFMNKSDANHYADRYNLEIGKANIDFSDLLIEKLDNKKCNIRYR